MAQQIKNLTQFIKDDPDDYRWSLYSQLEKTKDDGYKERNRCIAFLSKATHFGKATVHAWLATHQPIDDDWDDEWRNVIVIMISSSEKTIQLTWHIHDNDLPLFAHLEHRGLDWKYDGHTTEEKYQAMENW